MPGLHLIHCIESSIEGGRLLTAGLGREVGASLLIDDNPTYACDCAGAGMDVILYNWKGSYPWSRLPGDRCVTLQNQCLRLEHCDICHPDEGRGCRACWHTSGCCEDHLPVYCMRAGTQLSTSLAWQACLLGQVKHLRSQGPRVDLALSSAGCCTPESGG